MRTEKFNPYEHLTICQTPDGDLIMEPVEQNGMPVLIEDDKGHVRIVQMPKMYLNRFALTDWFWEEFPEGAISDELETGREWNGECFVYTDEIILKVTLLSDREKKTVLSTAYGIVKRSATQENRKDVLPFAAEFQGKDGPYRLAYYIALKTAMERAGFIYENDYETLKKHLPFFFEVAEAGPIAKWVPVDKSQVLSAKKEGVKLSECEPEVTEPVETCQPAAEMPPKIKEPVVPEETPKTKDALAFIAAMTASPVEEEKQSSLVNASLPEVSEPEAEADILPKEDLIEEAKKVIYHVIPGGVKNERLSLMEGKALGEMDGKMIEFIATRPSLEGQLTVETITAAKVIAGIL